MVDYDYLRNGYACTGQLFSLWAMATKLALAFSVGTALPLLEWIGFNPTDPTEGGRIALKVIYAGLPIVIKITAIAAIWSFPLNARKHATIRRRLETRGITPEVRKTQYEKAHGDCLDLSNRGQRV